jgi:hypothetical protein
MQLFIWVGKYILSVFLRIANLDEKVCSHREYIEENTMPSQHACYGTVSYRVGSAGPILDST